MGLKITILGCGSSGGVPRLGDVWGACDPENPRNRRRRCSILVQRANEQGAEPTNVLVDTSPDMRAQLLEQGVGWLDGVLYTHDHADHTHGIDDLRMVAFNGRRHVDVHMSHQTAQVVMTRFSYCFRAPEGSPYPPILREHEITHGACFTIDGEGGPLTFEPLTQVHGDIHSLAFRIGPVAYCSDVSSFPDATMKRLEGLDLLVIDSLQYKPHPSHFSLGEALEMIERLKPVHGVLTHMHTPLDYNTVMAETPAHVEPAHDGMVLEYPL